MPADMKLRLFAALRQLDADVVICDQKRGISVHRSICTRKSPDIGDDRGAHIHPKCILFFEVFDTSNDC